jgi:hypothetical protein
MRLMPTVAPHTADVVTLPTDAAGCCRARTLSVAHWVVEPGRLRPGPDTTRVDRLRTFYSSVFALVDGLRRSSGYAMGWIHAAAGEAMPAHGTGV